jgi:hypothetical protein
MNTLRKIKAACLIMCIALGVMIASTQESKAAYYNYYYSDYLYYLNLYRTYGVAQYYWDAIGFYYYYLAGYYGDYYGYYYDAVYYKSTNYRGSNSNALYYYNLYAADGDYYIRF